MRAKPAAQRRSADKRDRILKAMDTLLKRKPFSHINVADVARQAKLSPATLYQRFSNEDATASVLLELYYHKVEEWARRPRKAPSGVLFDALVDIAADAFDQVAELGYVMRPAYLYSRYRPDRAGPEWKRLEQVAIAGFKAFLSRHAAEIRQSDLDEAAALVAYLYNMLLLGPLLHADDTQWKVIRRRDEFVCAVATVAHRYLSASG